MTRAGSTSEPDDRASERRAMVDVIAAHAREVATLTGASALAPRVMSAMRRVPRHEFVPADEAALAYADAALPIGRGQTISQPFIVALMTDLARVGAGSVVLEVGTGCGYQAAVLAEIAARVYTIEFVPELAQQAALRLARLGYSNVEVRSGDGNEGWEEHAPFDAILVTAAARDVPPRLVAQLAPRGRLVIPVHGGTYGQELMLLEKDAEGEIRKRSVLPVAFVPLVGAAV